MIQKTGKLNAKTLKEIKLKLPLLKVMLKEIAPLKKLIGVVTQSGLQKLPLKYLDPKKKTDKSNYLSSKF
jgi:hypothetical protein